MEVQNMNKEINKKLFFKWKDKEDQQGNKTYYLLYNSK